MPDFEKLAAGVYLEGLAVDHQRNIVWYSDVIAGGIHGVYPDGRVKVLNPDRMWTGGVMINQDGAVLSSGQGGIMWNNPDTGASGWLLHEIDGKVINGINEMVPDGSGGIFFGTNDIEMVIAGKPSRPTALYRLTVDRDVILLAEGLNFTNGLMYDAERRKFYCSDTFACAWVFDVEDDLSLTNKQVWLDKNHCDGLALDSEGNTWITLVGTDQIARQAPDGSPMPPLDELPGSVTQVRFGGADLRDCYLNVVPVDSGETLKNGEMLAGSNSFLYRFRSAIPGMPVLPAAFALGE